MVVCAIFWPKHLSRTGPPSHTLPRLRSFESGHEIAESNLCARSESRAIPVM